MKSRIPPSVNVVEYVSRQFGGRQVPSNQHFLDETLNKMLGPIEYRAARDLPDGTVILGFDLTWLD